MSEKMIKERYELAHNRIASIQGEKTVKEPFLPYFKFVASFLGDCCEVLNLSQAKKIRILSLEELKKLNLKLYEDIVLDHYHTSFSNPSYTTKLFGEKYGKLLAFIYTELRSCIVSAFEGNTLFLTIYLELFIEVYNYFENENDYTYKDVKSTLYYFMSDYSEIIMSDRTRQMLDPECDFATKIIMESDLTKENYLYYFGEYITENEILISKFLNKLSQDEIDAMASTYTEGFHLGFLNNNIDLSKKSVVNIRYCIGFERIVKAAIKQFETMGLKPTIYRAAVNSLNKKQHLKIGYYSTSPNKQYDYDHRFDQQLYLDKALNDRKLVNLRLSYEKVKDLANQYAGPAVIEIFGEKPFEPKSKEESCVLDDKQQKLSVNYNREAALITNEYIKSEEYSFTIIAFPIPEIGDNFESIFRETCKVNTLDYKMYQEIQQTIIDTLDLGKEVHILGKGKNNTDLIVKLYELKDKSKETIFENCVADVNIPVGEVFTSPKLEGTNGRLHVSEVYLNDLKYIDLELVFENGRIKGYTCKNFESEVENKAFIKENLMYNQESLPLGEFAIGTNTTAYVMGKKFEISHLLPILIAEKTGPHFAVGDTCYKMSEDNRVFNPDGKEIVAKDNEISILRKTKIEEAYFNCHTDITIPYDELGEISVLISEIEKIDIIKNGTFVLKGTEKLNIPLEALDN